jgi:hypothetical protein
LPPLHVVGFVACDVQQTPWDMLEQGDSDDGDSWVDDGFDLGSMLEAVRPTSGRPSQPPAVHAAARVTGRLSASRDVEAVRSAVHDGGSTDEDEDEDEGAGLLSPVSTSRAGVAAPGATASTAAATPARAVASWSRVGIVGGAVMMGVVVALLVLLWQPMGTAGGAKDAAGSSRSTLVCRFPSLTSGPRGDKAPWSSPEHVLLPQPALVVVTSHTLTALAHEVDVRIRIGESVGASNGNSSRSNSSSSHASNLELYNMVYVATERMCRNIAAQLQYAADQAASSGPAGDATGLARVRSIDVVVLQGSPGLPSTTSDESYSLEVIVNDTASSSRDGAVYIVATEVWGAIRCVGHRFAGTAVAHMRT